MYTLTPTLARRLAITRQRLAGQRPTPDSDGILDVVRDLGCLQLDPTNAVARSHLLVLWSRLGHYDTARLDALLWRERRLFEYWAHAASIVPTDDYPIHQVMMRDYGRADTSWGRRIRAWMEENAALRDGILSQLAAQGPLPARAFEDTAVTNWRSTGWTGNRNVDRMLAFLWGQGAIMVAGRAGNQKLWELAERHLPAWASREYLTEREAVRIAVRKSLRALGVARPAHIEQHFIRGRYPDLMDTLSELEAAGELVRVRIAEDDAAWPGPWYAHVDDIPLLDRLATDEAGAWEPRTTLLSPFDNLLCDRQRTETLFDFSFRLEIYLPRDRRQYGYYVLPILHGDRLIGRVDPLMDRKRGRLVINAVYAEPHAPMTGETARAVASAVEELGAFLGATEVVYSDRVPVGWRGALVTKTLDRDGTGA